MLEGIREEGYKSHAWQYIKRLLADPAVECIITTVSDCIGPGCIKGVYIADLTGGEPSYLQDHGGKDVDIIIYAPSCEGLDENVLESGLDQSARIVIAEVLGFDPIEELRIPNVIEIHVVRGPEDAPYYNMLNSRYSRLVKVWPPSNPL
ncbi:MAG: hypothetical protein F7C33_00470 [Desulfurococcales archaeon]|nr:hypothetical protein [Desulfurococcales archaeon]